MIREEVQQMEGAWRHFLSGGDRGKDPPRSRGVRKPSFFGAFRPKGHRVSRDWSRSVPQVPQPEHGVEGPVFDMVDGRWLRDYSTS